MINNFCLVAVFLSVGILTTGALAYVEGDINSGAEASEGTSFVVESEEQADSEDVAAFAADTGTDVDDESEEQSGYVCGEYLEVVESVTQTAESTTEETNSVDEETLLALYESLLQSGDSNSSSSLSLTPEGNLTLVDNITDSTSGKQFITVCTKSGNYFYLIIDEDDEGESTVHFLNQVDEADLLALMDEEDVAEYEESLYGTDTEETEEADTSEADASTLEDEEPEEMEEKSNGVNLLPVILLVVVLAAGGGFFAYAQVMNKKKEETRPDPDADYTGADDELELPEDDFYSEDEADTDGGFFDDEPV